MSNTITKTILPYSICFILFILPLTITGQPKPGRKKPIKQVPGKRQVTQIPGKKTGKPKELQPKKQPGKTGIPKKEEIQTKPAEVIPRPITTGCVKHYVSGKSLNMNGIWEIFLSRKNYSYSRIRSQSKWRKIRLPSMWGDSTTIKKYLKKNKKVHAWYRCSVILNGKPDEHLAIYLGQIEGIDNVFFNNKKIGHTGTIKPYLVDTEKLRLYALPSNLWHQGENLIVIHIYSTTQMAGLREDLKIHNQYTLKHDLIISDTPKIVFSVIYIQAALFFGIFFIFFRHQRENLYLSLFSASLGLYFLIRTNMRYEFFSSFSFSFKIELILLFALPVLFFKLHY